MQSSLSSAGWHLLLNSGLPFRMTQWTTTRDFHLPIARSSRDVVGQRVTFRFLLATLGPLSSNGPKSVRTILLSQLQINQNSKVDYLYILKHR